MTQPYFFQPIWPFLTPAHYFPVLQINSFQNIYYTPQNSNNQIQTIQNICLEKKTEQCTKKANTVQKRQIEKKKVQKKSKEDRNFSYRYQDKDRNIYSNILKGLISKIRQEKCMQEEIQKMITKGKYSFKFEELILFLDSNFLKGKTYISPAYMKKVIVNEGNAEIRKLLRLIVSKYLKESFTLVLLRSQRIQKNSKLLQMQKSRQLWRQIFRQQQDEERLKIKQLQ